MYLTPRLLLRPSRRRTMRAERTIEDEYESLISLHEPYFPGITLLWPWRYIRIPIVNGDVDAMLNSPRFLAVHSSIEPATGADMSVATRVLA